MDSREDSAAADSLSPWPKRSKQEHLPIQKNDFGFFQKTDYNNPDLYHEEVIELDSPFEVLQNNRVFTRTVLVIGDQNAGKSTFLHSFTAREDLNFTRLTAVLPILQASFLNSRFLPEDDQPIDELPFIDTDIARSTVLVGMDDWNFLLDEQGLAMEQTKCATLCLQLIEIGGDHLDRMMALQKIENAKLQSICHQTLQLLKSAEKLVYVLNGSNLNTKGLSERFSFIKEQNPSIEMLVCLSRGSSAGELEQSYLPFEVVDGDGQNLNVRGIVDILCNLVRSDQLVSHPDETASLIVEHLISFWKSWSHDFDGTSLSLWITEELFYDYLCHAPHGASSSSNSIPLGNVIGEFKQACALLVANRFAIQRHSALTSDIRVHIWVKGELQGHIRLEKEGGKEEMGIRFPLFGKIFDALSSRESLPSKLWIKKPAVVAPSLIEELEAMIGQSHSSRVFLVLLDEWQTLSGKRKLVLKKQDWNFLKDVLKTADTTNCSTATIIDVEFDF
jgi:hypothetical protein